MAKTVKSTTLYNHPFSKAYWRDAAAELKDTKMLVITALMIALRVALKPLAIQLGPQLGIQTAMLATALGAMLFGPVVAIPAAIVSDTIGFIIFPNGDYFLPFMLTEIASTMIYALFLYRAKPTATRVMLARFLICFLVNVVLQQLIIAWQYDYMGNPEGAKNQIMGIMTVARIFKNLCMFPIETVALTLFLKMMLPVLNRAKLSYARKEDMQFTKKQIAAMVCLLVIGAGTATGYLAYRYTDTSRSADYTAAQRVDANKEMTLVVTQNAGLNEEQQLIGIVDSAFRSLFGKETDYTVSVYALDEEAFAAGQAQDSKYTVETLWGYSKSGPSKDKYQSLIKLGTATFCYEEKTEAVSNFQYTPAE